MPGFGHKHYVPFLKGKAGELKALAKLDVEERGRLTPLIEVAPLKVNPKTGQPTENVDKALDGFAAKLVAAWGSLDHCFLDIAEFDPDARLQDGRHPLAAFFTEAKEVDLAAIPVTGLDRDGAQLEAVEEVCSALRRGAAFRLRRADLRDPERLSEDLRRLNALLDLGAAEIDLLFDLGELGASQLAAVGAEAAAAIRAMPDIGAWRSLTVCSGAFPTTVSQFVKPGESGELARRDWTLWRELLDLPDPLPRLPAFGDYGVAASEWLRGFDPEIMSPAAKIIYTTEEDWLVVRGRSVKKHGYDQYRDLAGQLVKRDEFCDTKHCWGDEAIVKCANGSEGTGNLTTWVTVATRHHLEVVDCQLASLP